MSKKTKQVGELIFGVHPILELLKTKRRKLIAIYTTKPEPKVFAQVKRLMPKYPVAIQYVKRDILHKMAETTDHQGIVAWVQKYPFKKKFFESKKDSFLLMLDGIQDPRNLGAILRSAYCTGVDGVILIKKGSAPLNAVALKASAGLAERLEIFVASSAKSAVQQLKDAGYKIYLAVLNGQDATKSDFTEPLCLVVGGEGSGISKMILSYGKQITLPQSKADISYNASVAAGILLFWIKNNIV